MSYVYPVLEEPAPEAQPTPDESQIGSSWGGRALTVAAVLGTICLITAILSLTLGVRPVVFETGSMAPTIPAGSLGVSRTVAATDIETGDVVGVIRQDGVRVTHRVVSVDGVTGNSATLTLRGDANDVDDPRTYVVAEAHRVSGTVPLLGYVVIWLKNPFTLALQGLAVLFLLAIVFAPRQGWRNSSAGQRILTGTAAATVVAVSVAGTVGNGEARAALTGEAKAIGTVQAGTPDVPAWFTCENVPVILVGTRARLSWPNPPEHRTAGYSYELRIGEEVFETFAAQNHGDVIEYTLTGTGLITRLVAALIAALMGDSGDIELTSMVGSFRSTQTLKQGVYASLAPLGTRCDSAGTVEPENYAQADPDGDTPALDQVEDVPGQPASTTSGEGETVEGSEPDSPGEIQPDESLDSDTSDDREDSSEPEDAPESPAAEPAAPELPAGGTLDTSGTYAFYSEGGQVTIRDRESTDIEYRGTVPAGSTVRWQPGSQILEITDADGTVTTVAKTEGTWRETVTAPPAPVEPEPADAAGPEAEPESAGTAPRPAE